MEVAARQQTVLLCVTGCIAAYKACEVLRLLQKAGYRVKVLMTEHATEFVGPQTFRALTHEKVALGLFDDPEDPIHHISLAQEADVVLVAPATANIIAKMAHGIADDLMSTTLLATRAPILVAPAMNTAMWDAPVTQENIRLLKARGVRFISPVAGRLACGDVGAGKLSSVEEIAWHTKALLYLARTGALASLPDYAGQRVLVTAGGTQEDIDPVRYIGNRSSGTFGYAIARAARFMGAEVTLVSAPTALAAPEGINLVSVRSAQEMFDAVSGQFPSSTMFISAAAVADYAPVQKADHKLKKQDEHLDSVALAETRDILATMCAQKGDRTVIGFAAETGNLEQRALDKLKRKGCDAIVANDVSKSGSGFGSPTDEIAWVHAGGIDHLPLLSKDQAAFEILLRAARL